MGRETKSFSREEPGDCVGEDVLKPRQPGMSAQQPEKLHSGLLALSVAHSDRHLSCIGFYGSLSSAPLFFF